MTQDDNGNPANDTSTLVSKLSMLGALSNSTRVGIMVVLLALKKATFTDILVAVKTSKSSLSTSLSILERAGYIKIEHGFFRKGGPRTVIVITAEGDRAITEYLDLMDKLTRNIKQKNME